MTRAEQRRIRFGRDRVAGFTPSRNLRIDGAIQAMVMVVSAEGGRNIFEIREEAVRRVARNLPAAATSKLYRDRPSKNDSPVYRKQVVAEAVKPKRSRAKKVA